MSYISRDLSRRHFLRRAGYVSAVAGTPFAANLMAVGAASAQSTSGYKALVCVYLSGGNDQSNTLVPYSTAEYNAYQASRPTLALARESLQTISPSEWSGPQLGFNANASGLRNLFNSRRVAVVANVGTLCRPTSKAQYDAKSVPLPTQLFSHSDQSGAWQTGIPAGVSSTGWMGRIGDVVNSAYNADSGVSIAMSVAGNTVMLAGNQTIQYQLTTQGAVRVKAQDGLYGFRGNGDTAKKLMEQWRAHLLEDEYNNISDRAMETEVLVTQSLNTTSMNTAFPNTSIGQQLRMVARMIAARGPLQQNRQIFFVQAGGWDFHDNLVNDHNNRLRELNEAMVAFDTAMSQLGVNQQVTTFTASDFGRALQSNGRGADHGWGGHHLVMGGAVRGNRIYGEFPTVALGTAQDAGQGRLIPTTSTDEYMATLASWFGVSSTDMPIVLPNLTNFSRKNLGFMG